MLQDYFIVNGTKYYTGTIFIINNMGKNVEASFICYDTNRSRYTYRIKEHTYHITDKIFDKWFVGVTNKKDPTVHMPLSFKVKDREIHKLFIGWIWYIVLMTVGSIFKYAIFIWIFLSVIFFSWKAEVIKKEGNYIEW